MSYRKQLKQMEEADKAIRRTIVYIAFIGIIIGSIITYLIMK